MAAPSFKLSGSPSLVREDAVRFVYAAALENRRSIEQVHDVSVLLEVGRRARRDHPDLAVDFHRRAVEITAGAERAFALAAYAASLRRTSRPADALHALDESLRLEGSFELNRRAWTCRVAVLRELERVDEARRIGERLREHHPEDPKVLRALAAVVSAHGDDERADALFEIAHALDELDAEDVPLAELAEVARRDHDLALLQRLAATVEDDPRAPRFCAFEVWEDELRPRLAKVVEEQATDPRLKTRAAYELVRHVLYQTLPPCRNCGRLAAAVG